MLTCWVRMAPASAASAIWRRSVWARVLKASTSAAESARLCWDRICRPAAAVASSASWFPAVASCWQQSTTNSAQRGGWVDGWRAGSEDWEAGEGQKNQSSTAHRRAEKGNAVAG